ncbi:Nop52-domain-containing protein [Cristinia sonorae]|uniref:Nop52-domain-containing protein n=1 Tax=Cristinia sonorae TaxID=1940300 RepID=A0A8K0UNC1_9AGAR|nr:Nop52-domain-containing protein [Cristinia sonorae]
MADDKSLPFGKHLASSDKKTRDNAVNSLTAFLSGATDPLPQAEMAKLWKGIFYCFWMSDKPLVQQALATDLAQILLSIPSAQASLAFLKGFWESIVREWSGIDRLRLDKYYLLIRRFVNASFRLLARETWDEALINQYNTILTAQGGPLCPDDIRIPSGLTYHLADVYIEELNKASANPPIPSPLPTPLITIIRPFLDVAARTPTKTTYQRIQSAFIDPLLEALATPTPNSEDEQRASKRQKTSTSAYDALLANACLSNPAKEGVLTKEEIRKAILKRIFDIAGSESTRDANRRKMYVVWRSNADEDEE